MDQLVCVCGEVGEFQQRRISFGNRTLFLCRSCGTAQLYPYPNADVGIYDRSEYHCKISKEEYLGYFLVYKEILQRFSLYEPSKRILDFGAGHCCYHEFLLKDGFTDVHSYEINPHLVEEARARIPSDNVHSRLEDLKGEFDIIIANHVLEHIPDLKAPLRRILTEWLRPGGVLILALPNFDSWSRHVLYKRWLGWSPQEHIWFFTPTSLRRLLESLDGAKVLTVVAEASVNKPYNGFFPNTLFKKIYFHTLMRFFEAIGKGDQIVSIVQKARNLT